MNSRTTCSISRPMLWAAIVLGMASADGSARADGIYSITGLGTLSGQSSSVATSINNSGGSLESRTTARTGTSRTA